MEWSAIGRHYGADLGAVFANVIAARPPVATAVAAVPAGSPQPPLPTLFVAAGVSTAGLTLERLGDGGRTTLTVSAGPVHLVSDLQAIVLA
jgi:hypothetical protein